MIATAAVLGAVVVVVGWACSSIDVDTYAYCPSAEEGFRVDYGLERDARDAIKALLQDPGSYKEYRIFSRMANARTRDDGTEYFRRLEVEFGARNGFGGMVRGRATVDLEEHPEDGCQVTRARLYE